MVQSDYQSTEDHTGQVGDGREDGSLPPGPLVDEEKIENKNICDVCEWSKFSFNAICR